MLKITFLMRRLPSLSREEFQTYYRKVHTRAAGPDATDILGMKRYVQLHALSEDVNDKFGESRGGEPSFDAVAEIWLDSYEAYERDWKSEDGAKVVCGACGKDAVYPNGDELTKSWIHDVEREHKLFAGA